MLAIRVSLLIYVSSLFFAAAADDVVVPDDGNTSQITRAASDFHAEFQCAKATNTKFGPHNSQGPLSANERAITPSLVTVPAIRKSKRGFYSLTPNKGVRFFDLELRPSSDDDTIRLFEMEDPDNGQKFVLDVDGSAESGTIFYKAPDDFKDGAEDRLIKTPPVAANDSDAENAILAVLTDDIQSFPDEAFLCLNLKQDKCTDEDVIKVLRAIVCGCVGHPILRKAVRELESDPRIKKYKDKLLCEVSSI